MLAPVPASRHLVGKPLIEMTQFDPLAARMNCEVGRLDDIGCCTTAVWRRSLALTRV
jgi:hypothetical protein